MAPDQPWTRRTLVWQHALFAVALALPTLGAVPAAGHPAAGLSVVATLAAWYGYWFVVRRGAVPPHLAYLIGAAALWALATAADPGLLGVGVAVLVPYCIHRPPWAATAFLLLTAAWLAHRALTGGAVTGSTVLACGLGVLAAVAVVGYIATLDREGRHRQRLLDELAAAHAELAATERWAGTLAERQRLARDIHDTLTQGFASIALVLDAARDDLPTGGPAARRVEQALRTARENLVESRRLINALRPAQLDGARLPYAVRQLTDRLTEETTVDAHTVITGDPVPLSDTAETQLLRVVQEALTNVRRHAAATEVTVTLSYVDDMLVIDVQDDGIGIPTGIDAPAHGVGLAGMRERVDSLAGTLAVESAPCDGTTIALSVPVATT
ncbi:MAG: sensor histidine kinase [Actinophytocola sp.]|uniref:sensor histidine kinase n=1 Tax=Actinophytocola sp. TaxID=1872138 RepID=UPI0013222FD3|nr:sensor histidine kinase [Actinophytocola sp.]MPZ81933.1 sensor histidine kinase [Actinophytocola sp.]